MKLKDVMLGAMAKRITCYQAAEILSKKDMKDCLIGGGIPLCEASAASNGGDSLKALSGAIF